MTIKETTVRAAVVQAGAVPDIFQLIVNEAPMPAVVGERNCE
jgi:hypothetical protein